MFLSIRVNGKLCEDEVEDRTLLVEWLRDHLGLTGTHVGCDTSQCGCCTVHLDGEAVKSCSILAAQAHGCSVVSIEGLAESVASSSPGASGGVCVHPLQVAFAECHALQCGFCTPGMIMASADLLQRNPNPSDDAIAEALAGNLCRCTGYVNIIAAVKRAAARMACTGPEARLQRPLRALEQ